MEKTSPIENNNEVSDQPVNTEVTDKESNPNKLSIFLKGLLKGNVSFSSLQSIAFRLSLVFFIILILVFVYREFTDKSYRIQAFSLPEDFMKDGYTGSAIALQLMDEVNEMVVVANERRTLKEVEEYDKASDRVDIKVEVGGVGISPETIAAYLKTAFGVRERSISGVIVRNNTDLKLILRMSGHTPVTLTEKIDSLPYSALSKLITQGAEAVLKWNNPLLSGLYFYSYDEYDKAIESFRIATFQQPEERSTAYAHWGDALLNQTDDTVGASIMLSKALAINPNNGTAYRLLGNMATSYSDAKAERLYRKSLEIDPTSGHTWYTLAYKILDGDTTRDKETLACYRKSYELDKTNFVVVYEWTKKLYLTRDYEQAYDKLQVLRYLNPRFGYTLNIAIAEALKDTVQAMSIFESVHDRKGIGYGLNELAYGQELKGNFPTAFRLVNLSLQADSISERAATSFSTLAELCGLTNNTEGFYVNFEKALKLGFESKGVEKNEPYHSLADTDRYRKLIAKYTAK